MMDGSFYKKTVLPNGLRIITEKIPYVHSVSIGIWILAGTIDETREQNGIAHFVEHILFKGTKRRSALEIVEALESVGGHINAFTGKDVTCLYAHVLDEHVSNALEILSDMLLNPKLAHEDIENEKQVIYEEIREVEDTPEELVHETFVHSLYDPHPLGFSTLGTYESVRQISRQSIIEFLENHYTANRILVVAAGNVEHEFVLDLSHRFLGDLPKGQERRNLPIPPEKKFHLTLKNNFQQAHICIGRRCINYSDPRRYAMLLLNTILGLGMSSRLFQTIREKNGLAYSVYSFADFLKDTGLIGVYLGTDKNKVEKAKDLVFRELEKLQNSPPEKTELTKKKNQLKGNLLLGMESTSNRMNRLAKTEINYGRLIPVEAIISEIEAVTREQIQSLARDFLCEEKLSSVLLLPNS